MAARYIGYPNIGGFASGYPEFFSSIEDASDWLRENGDSDFLYLDGQRDSVMLYRVINEEMIEDAKEMNGIGCPFDYPDTGIEFGPRGGIRKIYV